MLAESGYSWSDQWEQGRSRKVPPRRPAESSCGTSNGASVPSLRISRRVEAIASIEEATGAALRAGAASSLDDIVHG